MKLKTDCHVLVCDGGKFLLLRNVGDEDIMNLEVVDHREVAHEAASDIGRDRPGSFPVGDMRRGRGDIVDPHLQAKGRFVRSVVDRLDELYHSEEPIGIVLVADHRSLGTLREYLAEDVKSAVLAEIAADHVHHTVADIEASLMRYET